MSPPHVVARAIEASGAYHRRFYRDAITDRQLNRIFNHLFDRTDLFQLHALEVEEDLDLFIQSMARQQLLLQDDILSFDILRIKKIFEESPSNQPFRSAFAAHTGMDLMQWAYLCLASAHLAKAADRSPVIDIKDLARISKGFVSEAVALQFLDRLSLRSSERGNLYRERRTDFERQYLRGQCRSTFLDFPLVRITDTSVVVPIPGLVARASFYWPVRMRNELNRDASSSLSRSVEEYLKYLLERVTDGEEVILEAVPEDDSEARRCDLIAPVGNDFLLVEAKLTDRLPILPTENALRSSNYANRVVEAWQQLIQSSRNLSNTHPEKWNGDNTSTVLGIAVVPQAAPLCNSNWFVEKVIKARAEDDQIDLEDIGELSLIPQTMAISHLELLVTHIVHSGMSIKEIVEARRGANYSSVGEWDTHIRNHLAQDKLPYPDWVRDEVGAWLQTLFPVPSDDRLRAVRVQAR